MFKQRSSQQARRGVTRWWTIVLVLFLAACSTAKSTAPTAKATATASPGVPVATTQPGVHPTAVSGAWSLYVDPTYGYSFQYPSSWTVDPAVGEGESNVVMNEPLGDPNDPNYPKHPWTQLLIRASNDFGNSTFVQHLLCNASSFSGPYKVAGYPTEDLTTYGGDTTGFTAPAFGLAFFAKDKNLAVEIWLQSSAKATDYHDYISDFFDIEKPVWVHVLSSFNVGPGTKLASSC